MEGRKALASILHILEHLPTFYDKLGDLSKHLYALKYKSYEGNYETFLPMLDIIEYELARTKERIDLGSVTFGRIIALNNQIGLIDLDGRSEESIDKEAQVKNKQFNELEKNTSSAEELMHAMHETLNYFEASLSDFRELLVRNIKIIKGEVPTKIPKLKIELSVSQIGALIKLLEYSSTIVFKKGSKANTIALLARSIESKESEEVSPNSLRNKTSPKKDDVLNLMIFLEDLMKDLRKLKEETPY